MLFISLTHLSHALLSPLFISLYSFVWSSNMYKHPISKVGLIQIPLGHVHMTLCDLKIFRVRTLIIKTKLR